jgi:hypothetical protein
MGSKIIPLLVERLLLKELKERAVFLATQAKRMSIMNIVR